MLRNEYIKLIDALAKHPRDALIIEDDRRPALPRVSAGPAATLAPRQVALTVDHPPLF